MQEFFFPFGGTRRRAAAALVGGAGLAFVAASAQAAGGGVQHMRCTNPIGGAHWSIEIDLDRGVVDQRPATIGDAWIKWSDAKGGVYELERATGKLSLRAASTTGGYFLHYKCESE
jgi:hypothetical protein